MIGITINITADSAEEARKAMLELIGGDPTVALAAEINREVAQTASIVPLFAPVKEHPLDGQQKQTRPSRAKKPEGIAPDTPTDTDYKAAENVPVKEPEDHSNETISAPASDDLLGSSPAIANTPPASNGAQRPAETPKPPQEGEPVTKDALRAKIASLRDYRTQVISVIGTFTKADGSPCITAVDIQEKDYAAIYKALDAVMPATKPVDALDM